MTPSGKVTHRTLERFMSHYVEIPGPLPTPCRIWTGAKNNSGYGVYHADKSRLVHRFAWILFYGFEPDLHVCHKCHNSDCFNPLHLILGTIQDNADHRVARAWAQKGALAIAEELSVTDPPERPAVAIPIKKKRKPVKRRRHKIKKAIFSWQASIRRMRNPIAFRKLIRQLR